MQDPFPIIPSRFFPTDDADSHDNGSKNFADIDVDAAAIAAAAKPGRSVVASVYRTKIGGRCRPITVAWCRDLLGHGFSVAVGGAPDPSPADAASSALIDCRVDLRPWQFWRRHGSKRFPIDVGATIQVFWDLRSAKFSGEQEPKSGYYVAVAADGDLVLLLGDLQKEAYRRSGLQPAPIDAALVSKKEHIFGRRTFSTRARFHEKGRSHDITIERRSSGFDSEMAIAVDGEEVIAVKRLQWKFRGNQSITVGKARVEVYWDVHDWLFNPGTRHALFIFKPSTMPMAAAAAAAACSSASTSTSSTATLSSLLSSSSSSSSSTMSTEKNSSNSSSPSGYCLFLYAWKLD